MLILIHTAFPDEQIQQLRALSPDIEIVRFERKQPVPKDVLARTEIMYTESAQFDLADAPRLRWVQTDSAATNPVRGAPVMQPSCKIPVHNAGGAYSVPVAECAVGMLIAMTRRITLGTRYQLKSEWSEDFESFCGEDLHGLTMGIVGYGSIGRQIAHVVSAMGMNILACKRRPEKRVDDETYVLPGSGDPEGRLPREWFGLDRLHDMLRKSDVVTITLPHTPHTERLIGAAELQAIPPHAYFVNVGRGAVVDEPALVKHLQDGKLAGAALDVTAVEPLPSSSPLWAMPNVLIMPHIASWTRTQGKRSACAFIENVRRELAGKPLLNVVDKTLLY